MLKRALIVIAAVAATMSAAAQNRPPAPAAPRIYVFDNGAITGLDIKLFNFAPEEIREPDFVNVSYLVVHPKGTLQFDAGGIPDHDLKEDGVPVREGVLTASRRLIPQLATAGYRPSDITHFAMSHYHSDHTANANEFAGATWIVQRAEHDYMFQPKPQGIIRPAHYEKLRNAKTRILHNEDLDVFGDGTVVIMSTPGHTPGHQVLYVKLATTGGVILGGDLYHYPEELATGRVPTFEFDAAQSKASRARIAEFMKRTGAQLWIEHDIATHATLPKPPGYVH
jgi:N-acyl homoserine lactone hydrolase